MNYVQQSVSMSNQVTAALCLSYIAGVVYELADPSWGRGDIEKSCEDERLKEVVTFAMGPLQ